MSEKFLNTSPAKIERLEHVDFREIQELQDKAIAFAEEKLTAHTALHYHNPQHTRGVVQNVKTLLGAISSQASPVMEADQQTLQAYRVWELGVIAGAMFHDVVMESVITEQGTLQRQGGWEEGKNERESFELLKTFVKEHLREDNQYTELYISAAESAIKATIPNATSFATFSQEQLKDFDPIVLDALATKDREGRVVYQGLRLDSQYTKASLSGLVLSTADLAAARAPGVFFNTGNAEFWESKVPESTIALTFLVRGRIQRQEARELLAQCSQWRKIQVGVALWQRERCREHFSAALLKDLFEREINCSLPQAQYEYAAAAAQESFVPGMTETVLDSAKRYDEFVHRYAIAESSDESLTEAETALLREALESMGAKSDELQDCLERQGLNLAHK